MNDVLDRSAENQDEAQQHRGDEELAKPSRAAGDPEQRRDPDRRRRREAVDTALLPIADDYTAAEKPDSP
jgi:hypothetical protein